MKISVFGLGYVGMVNIACFSKLGHMVYGCDIKQQKVDLLNQGESTVLEPGISELVEKSVNEGRIIASSDAGLCVENSDIALVCVGTPSGEDGSVNLNYIINTALEISKQAVKHNKPFTIVLRSTIPPGTVEDIILPAIAPVIKLAKHKINVVFLPEFLREGSAIKDFFVCSRIVIGLNDKQDGKEVLKELFTFESPIPIHFTTYRTAEFVKYVDNAFHATKVAFVNEIYSLGAAMGADVVEANKLFLLDDILNVSKKYLLPGMPFGGSCLPKDTRALIHMGNSKKVEMPFISGLFKSNSAHQKRILDKVLSFECTRIFFFGLTFKPNTDDIRESPFVTLLEELVSLGKEVKIYDQKLNLRSLRVDAPHLYRYVTNDRDEALKWSELVLLNDKNYDEVINNVRKAQVVLNCINNDIIPNVEGEVHNLYES